MTDIERGLKEAVAEAAAKRSTAQADAGDRWPEEQEVLKEGYGRAAVRSPRLPGTVEALAKAKAIHGEHGDSIRPFVIDRDVKSTTVPPLTAPQIIHLIEGLSKHAWGVHVQSLELSGLLAGQGQPQEPQAEPYPPTSIFDRMGQELLSLTRAIEGMEREINRSLGAIRP